VLPAAAILLNLAADVRKLKSRALTAQYARGMPRVGYVYRPARFVKSAKVLTFRDVSIEEIPYSDLEVSKPSWSRGATQARFHSLRRGGFHRFR
jgi:hypothetical protein